MNKTKQLHELIQSLTSNNKIIDRISSFMAKYEIYSITKIYEIIDENEDISWNKKTDIIEYIEKEIGISPIDKSKRDLFDKMLANAHRKHQRC